METINAKISNRISQMGAALMPKVSVEIPQELLDDLNRHVGDNKKFVSQSDAIRTAIRKMLDMMDDIDRRHGRLNK